MILLIYIFHFPLIIVPKLDRTILKRLPPHTTKEQAESDQNGHPDRVKTKGRQESRRKMGA